MNLTESYIVAVGDLSSDYTIVNETNKESEFYLTKEERKGLIILKYSKDVTQANKDRICLLVLKSERNKNQRKLVKIKNFSSKLELAFEQKQTESEKLILGLYNDSEKKDDRNSFLSSNKNDVITMVDNIFIKALKLESSDIHIEKRKDRTDVKMRVFGELSKVDVLFANEGEQIAKIIYQVYTAEDGEAGITFDQSVALNGVFERKFGNQRVRARISTLPAGADCYDVICRLLPFNDDGKADSLESLGYSIKEAREVEIMKNKASGAIIVAGVTGSGKSTTLKNILLSKLLEREGGLKCITVEDPPEYYIPGATQYPVNREKSDDGGSKAFQDAIKAAMRSDPDIIMVGEVRDKDTATLLRGAMESGHQVVTTLHASSAFSILNRLDSFGLTKELMSAPNMISGLIYQKLLPKLCNYCSMPLINGKIPRRYPLDKILLDEIEFYGVSFDLIKSVKEELLPHENLIRKLQDLGKISSKKAMKALNTYEKINDKEKNNELLERIKSVADVNESNIRFRGHGCKHCNSGISGRLVCAETVIPNLELLSLIGSGKDAEAITYWKTHLNGKYAIEDAIDKMKMGIIDPLDVEHAFQLLNIKI